MGQGEGRHKPHVGTGGNQDAQGMARDAGVLDGAHGNDLRHEQAKSMRAAGGEAAEQQVLGDWNFRWHAVSTCTYVIKPLHASS